MKQVLIVGGGSAGITVAARLKNAKKNLNITIVEPSDNHYYQPLWTLVGAGAVAQKATVRPTEKVVPKGVQWVRGSVEKFCPEKNKVILSNNGSELFYDYLVVSLGIQIDWDKVEGLSQTIGKNGVCSNYSFEYAPMTWKAMQSVKEGRAIFTFPNTTIKCGGAPQKIMWLAEHYFRKQGKRDKVSVEFVSPGERIFGVPKYRKTLEALVKERGIETRFHHNLEKIDGPNQKAYFRDLKTNDLLEQSFSMIHVTPPMSAPSCLLGSGLEDEKGWVDVDKYTLQHKRFQNVFSLGDCSGLPTSKTGAAVRKEAPVLVRNLLSHLEKRPFSGPL